MEMAYMGFTQEASIRHFRFECQIELPRPAAAPRKVIHFVVSAEMSLFLRYRIPIQDGPAICRRMLIEVTGRIPEGDVIPTSFSVLEPYMASLAAARTADELEKSARRHKSPIRPGRRSPANEPA
jgi:hypothetical protein